MKKGLRRNSVGGYVAYVCLNRDLMKKGLRRRGQLGFKILDCLNRDLMKKGLRRLHAQQCEHVWMFESRPYEEGIKTCLIC
jgi:hypothetical protein